MNDQAEVDSWQAKSGLEWPAISTWIGVPRQTLYGWLIGRRKCTNYPGGLSALLGRLLQLEQPEEARAILQRRLARGEPEPVLRQTKRPGAPEGITEPLQVEDSSQPAPPPPPPDREKVSESVRTLLAELSELRDQAEELLRWPGHERLCETMGDDLAPTVPRFVEEPPDLDHWVITESLDYVDTLPVLRHLATSMQTAVEAIQEHRHRELRSFLVWLLKRAGQALQDGREDLTKKLAWLDAAEACSKAVDSVRGWLQHDTITLWNLSHGLRESQEDLLDLRPRVESRARLMRLLLEEVEGRFVAWNSVYERLPRHAEFDFEGFVAQWDPFEVPLVINRPAALAEWIKGLSQEDPGDWEADTF